ncbi:hypothetical protein BpHYR1_039615 [Brachionus plicatilis]|uniref:Uncharacterized protein n=1 Tax=Brachionus plicatilis TaxID=10195 RepID=A0A3M7RHN4_BRAPC|nr:hypothetical protein BpHYR1_039615 [Brachionus plicatilis]
MKDLEISILNFTNQIMLLVFCEIQYKIIKEQKIIIKINFDKLISFQSPLKKTQNTLKDKKKP